MRSIHVLIKRLLRQLFSTGEGHTAGIVAKLIAVCALAVASLGLTAMPAQATHGGGQCYAEVGVDGGTHEQTLMLLLIGQLDIPPLAVSVAEVAVGDCAEPEEEEVPEEPEEEEPAAPEEEAPEEEEEEPAAPEEEAPEEEEAE